MMVHIKTGRKEILPWKELKRLQPLSKYKKAVKMKSVKTISLAKEKKPKEENTNNESIKHSKELKRLVKRSDSILVRVKTIFPFVFFTDQLIVDLYKITLEAKVFFFSKRYQSILVENISDVVVDTNLFFATIQITDRFYADNFLKVQYLPRNNAIVARNIIQGLVICHKHDVSLQNVRAPNLAELLEDLGSSESTIEEFKKLV